MRNEGKLQKQFVYFLPYQLAIWWSGASGAPAACYYSLTASPAVTPPAPCSTYEIQRFILRFNFNKQQIMKTVKSLPAPLHLTRKSRAQLVPIKLDRQHKTGQ